MNNNGCAIEITGLNKKFRIPTEKRNTIFQLLTGLTKNNRYREFDVLKNINLKIKKGEIYGIIGKNGSGKSTLLKIISKIICPDSGSVKTIGKIACLLELGVGFQPELTARDNVKLYSAIMGMNGDDIKRKHDNIFKFAELEEFKEMKIKNFSSGMYARLAFSTVIASKFDILLIDEILAVGDEKFQKKCYDKMQEFKDIGKTILFVSHDINSVKILCDKAILLHNGEIVENNYIDKVIEKYHSS